VIRRALGPEGTSRNQGENMKMTGFSRAWLAASTGALMLALGAGGASAACSENASSLLKKLDGSWRGSGTVKPIGGSQERLSCRVRYNSASANKMAQSISCAGTDYKFEAEANVSCEGDNISGTWSESVANNTGQAKGKITGDKLSIEVNGPNFQGHFNVQVTGTKHSLTITQFDPGAGRNVPVASVSLSK
jgi:hypothetical protein